MDLLFELRKGRPGVIPPKLVARNLSAPLRPLRPLCFSAFWFPSSLKMSQAQQPQDPKEKALQAYRKKLLEHKELDAKLRSCTCQTASSLRRRDPFFIFIFPDVSHILMMFSCSEK
jgi:hypothetical protein